MLWVDRLYTTKTDGLPRRSAQTALHHLLQTLTTLIAPVLSFTAEEIWETLHPGKGDSVFMHQHHQLPDVGQSDLDITSLETLEELLEKQFAPGAPKDDQGAPSSDQSPG